MSRYADHRGKIEKIDFITVVLRMSGSYWMAFCLENGLVGQGETKEKAIERLKEAVDSYQDVYEAESNGYTAPLAEYAGEVGPTN
ncbi:MAG: type II toxin-antitoxin system HicB family antitoxin [Candidatus Manganitrophaceae bacterium]